MALGRRGACGRVGAAVRRVGRRMGGVRKAAAARREAAKAAVGKKAKTLKPAADLSAEEREALVAALREYGKKATRERGYRPPSGADYVLEAARVGGVKISLRTARRWLACKRAIVRKARQSKARVHSRRTQRYLLACSQRGVAPGWLEGVDGPGW